MCNSSADSKPPGDAVVDAVRQLMTRHNRPVLVAIDGASGSGKSTFALWLADEFEAALVQSDDFFAAGISNAEWDARTPEERAADAIDWQRVRVEASNHFSPASRRNGTRSTSQRASAPTVHMRCAPIPSSVSQPVLSYSRVRIPPEAR